MILITITNHGFPRFSIALGGFPNVGTPTAPASTEDPKDFQAKVDTAPPRPRRENLRGHLAGKIP